MIQIIQIQSISSINIVKYFNAVYDFVHINPKIEHFFSEAVESFLSKDMIIKSLFFLA